MSGKENREILLECHRPDYGFIYTFYTNGTYHGWDKECTPSEWTIDEDGWLQYKHYYDSTFSSWDGGNKKGMWKDLPILLVEALIESDLL